MALAYSALVTLHVGLFLWILRNAIFNTSEHEVHMALAVSASALISFLHLRRCVLTDMERALRGGGRGGTIVDAPLLALGLPVTPASRATFTLTTQALATLLLLRKAF